ncbi:ribosome biogenesis GTP-binding protein YihA/YsxC [Oceanobacillus sp. CAU 1775]
MKINQAEFILSAVNQNHYPNDGLPEIALAGRSNVGKSSFINTLINRKNLARTSSKPGKTQTLNYYKLNESFYFVDVPGYGYAKVSKAERAKWGQMMDEYFQNRSTLKAVILVCDIRHEPTDADVQMYDFLKHNEMSIIVIATKFDKVKKSERHKKIKQVKNTFELDADDVLIPFSSETGEGKEEAWKVIRQYL